ncbi:HD domain-containing protein [Thiobaca trueperi]|uniref:HD Cas3-type domain-containing protein n=1 Tax=Thiobaca trueperi TaxID=127458 RepID=A0A4R3N2M9_9GAMM|nr:HD domain-containing protein [Thiobaca trueperi]TCT22984.1 hypothetical protein EDC35_102319 [Thiobaca trueperi]
MEYLADYFRYWGKADPAVETGVSWHPLVYHCLDVAACGQVLLRCQPAWLDKMAVLSGLDPVVLSPWLAFLLAIHDIGKFGDGFQALRPLGIAQQFGIQESSQGFRCDALQSSSCLCKNNLGEKR